MIELVNRNLVLVVDRKFNGAIKACSVHDLLRELCLERASKNNFCMKINTSRSSYNSVRKYKPRRIFTNRNILINNFFDQPSPWGQSLLCFHDMSIYHITDGYLCSYPLLTVLDLQKFRLTIFPEEIGLLVHLRYLAFWYKDGFPSSISNLWSLQTLIAKGCVSLTLPESISNLVNLRHLWNSRRIRFWPTEKPMNLETISNVALYIETGSWEKYFPAIKKLTCTTYIQKNQDFKSLSSLETLKWINGVPRIDKSLKIHVTFSASLKKLSLSGCCLPWSDMSIIQSLPNLEVLNIRDNAFQGPRWETGEVRFRQLKLLKLLCLDIQQWEASNINFPCLKYLVLGACPCLEEIPFEIRDIPTLELIDIDETSSSVVESVDRIQEEQQSFGNFELKISVRNSWRGRKCV